MNQPPFSSPLEETVVIVGVGLIGGSLAAALKQSRVAGRVIGVGRYFDRINAAREAGLIDEASTDLEEACARASVIVFCTPVEQIVDGVRSIAGKVTADALITDAGSVKQPICDALADVPGFIGSHPIAGSHRQGFEAADPKLYEGRLCVITPNSASREKAVSRLERFWHAVGMKTTLMSAEAHDQTLAMTSHLPHVVAAALAETLTEQSAPFTGTGFRDTTRIAVGDADLWTGILMQNSRHVLAGIDAMQRSLDAYRDAIRDQNAAQITELLRNAQIRRASLEK